MDFTDTNFLDSLLNFFYEHSVTGMIQLQPHAFELVCVLAIIDICSTWALYDGQMRMSFVINKTMKVGFFLLLIVNWDTINSAILRSFEIAGATASGLSNIGAGDWISPSKILERGFNICGTLFKDFQDTGITDNGGIARLFMDLIAIAITIASFFFISLQVLITKIEFCIFSSLGVILLPFGAIRFTSFLFQRVVSGVFSFGIKLMIMYFLLGLFDTLSGALTSFEENVSFSSMLKMALSYATLAFLVWKLPNLAASMMNGQPSMEAGDVVRGATTAKSTVAGAVGGAVGAAGAVSRVAGKTAAGYGFANATIKAAQANIGVQGGSVAGEVAKNVARTSFANSAIGKGLIRGANRAMNQMEDYKNLKSGEYATKPQSNRNR
ncbi:P-type conjugative transfer protein TrbL (plasmid) [Megamonas funiformis]|jgi:type IV secretion system protein TrbL|uniref:P-type conjugative transfer protein TrbL n=1 Tax=Megamonas funiformis YIT 11815 TaxID=742816 RepID=A0ABP2NGF3_9FIRM|nr:P-type conjugative transfer protein TrbL [Megamonas funiformis]EHR31891.1 P-type conjugative transfer protein TrbL [Megamonas funiformis YIT 11815]QIB61279.1 P-type conjugative transfer protein TrbL [Megamonas funiformis]